MSPRGGSLAVYAAVSFGYFAAIGLFNPYAPLWFRELGFSTLAIGAMASLQSWTRVVGPLGWGWLADHGGRHVESLRIAAVLACIASLGLLWVRAPMPVALFVLALFLANGGIVPLLEATLAGRLAGGEGFDTHRYGRVRMWGSIGFIASVTAMGLLLERTGMGVFPWLVCGLLVLLVAATLRLPATHEAARHAGGAGVAELLAALRRPAVAWFFASVFFTVLGHTALYAFFSLYLDALGHGKAVVGAMWAVSVVAEIVFFWTQGRWFTLWPAQTWLVVAGAAATLRFAVTAQFGSVVGVLVVAQLLHALSFAAHHASCIVMVHKAFPGRLQARGQALYTTLGYGLSGVLGGVGGGVISQRWGFGAVFWAAAAAALIGMLCALHARKLDAYLPLRPGG